ncbi:uncharacterized protein [Arachis hypogaea]|uniref:uncharacterized protein n=1 Tax=Arachis hypogaea TaxID=3818 RepID=UPI003B21F10A
MEYLEFEPSLEVFFALFQCKGVKRGGWLNLASALGRAIFSLYKSSYKGFKLMFLKVNVTEDEFSWNVDDCLLEKFSLFWCPRPRQILGMDKMEYRNEMVVEFLVNSIFSSGLLSVVELLEQESDKDVVSEYIEAPKVKSSSLRAFFRSKNVDKEGSSSHVKDEKGAEVNQPSPTKKVNYNRKRGDGKKEKVIDLVDDKIGGKEVDLDQVKRFMKNQRVLHGYKGDEDLTSLWSEHFPLSMVADKYCQSPADVKLVQEVGDIGICQYLQVMGAR